MKNTFVRKFLLMIPTMTIVAPTLCTIASCHKESKNSVDEVIWGNVITLDKNNTLAEGVAIDNGRIVDVGSKSDISKYITKNTEILDYSDQYIYPGFLDCHAHGDQMGLSLCCQAPLRNDMSYTEIIDTMDNWAQEHPTWNVLVGQGWQNQGTEPTYHDLDALSAKYPGKEIYLVSEDIHQIWVNKTALENKGITKEYASQYSEAVIRKFADGEPTGLLCDSEQIKLQSRIEYSPEQMQDSIKAWQHYAFSNGYTGVCEGAMSPQWADQYTALDKKGELKIRSAAVMYLFEDFCETTEDLLNEADKLLKSKEYRNHNFVPIGLKIFIDGVVEAKTALLMEESADIPGYYGLNRYEKFGTTREAQIEAISKVVERANLNDFSVHFHAAGDGAVNMAANAIDRAQQRTKIDDKANTILHCQLVDDQSFQLMKKNKICAGVAPLWCPVSQVYGPLEKEYIGKERQDKCYPMQKFIDNDITIGFHSDLPVTPFCHIPQSIFQACYRFNPTYDTVEECYDSLRNEYGQDISRYEALRAFTSGSAHIMRADDLAGSIEKGKLADFSIFNKNFLDCRLSELMNATVRATIVNGEVVYKQIL